MHPTRRLPALLLLLALVGCGGGSNNATPSLTDPTKTTPNGSASSTTSASSPSTSSVYTITDLGASTYYWNYYGYINNYGVYGSTLRCNDSGAIVSGSYGQAAVYVNGQLEYLQNAGPNSYNQSAQDVNNAGQVVGQHYNADSAYNWHGAIWQVGSNAITDVGALSGGESELYALNEAGDAAGSSAFYAGGYYYNYQSHAILYKQGQLLDLGTLGGYYSLASGVNASDTVVGWSSVTNSPYSYSPVQAWVWKDNTLRNLGTLPGGSTSDARGINDSGQIVGNSNTTPQGLYASAPLHAVTWINNAIQDLGTLGGPGSTAYSINNTGAIVGGADTDKVQPLPPSYGYVYGSGNGGTTGGTGAGGGTGGSNNGGGGSANAPTNPIASGAGGNPATNRAAHASHAGRSAKTRGIGDAYVSHAFLLQNGKMTDLNTLIDSTSGWELLQATDINNNGQIVGYGNLNNRLHAFLLTPK